MLDRINLKNAQSHVNTKLKFSSGLNVICGKTGSGKSAFYRALKLALLNKGKGRLYIRNGKSLLEIDIDIGKHKVKRIYGKKNKYVYDGRELNAIGKGIPKIISDNIKIGDLNFQDQFSAPYMLSMTAGQISKYINDIVNLNDIDKSQKYIKDIIRSENIKRETYESNIKEFTKQAKQYKGIDELSGMVNELVLQYECLRDEQVGINGAKKYILKVEDLKSKISNIKKQSYIKYKKTIEKLNHKMSKLIKTNGIMVSLIEVENKSKLIKNNIEIQKQKLESIKRKYKKIFPKKCPWCGSVKNERKI